MSSKPLFIFDAGSTKTDLIVYNNGQIKTRILSGYNPNGHDGAFLKEIATIHIPINSEIYFYGSGLGKDFRDFELNRCFSSNHVEFNNDLLGAARAAFSCQSGIILIMGTGGVVGYYDGQKITSQNGGYGYLIDDYGGGLELGKIIISSWLNEQYLGSTNSAIELHFNVNRANFISDFYKSKDLHRIAGICKIIPNLISNDRNLHHIVQDYFNSFFIRHVIPMCKEKGLNQISIVGSVALNFYSIINKSAALHEIGITSCIGKPIENLLKYHLKNKK